MLFYSISHYYHTRQPCRHEFHSNDEIVIAIISKITMSSRSDMITMQTIKQNVDDDLKKRHIFAAS